MSAAQMSGQQAGQLAPRSFTQFTPGQAPPCYYFQQGSCRNGEACPFKHEPVRCLCWRCLACRWPGVVHSCFFTARHVTLVCPIACMRNLKCNKDSFWTRQAPAMEGKLATEAKLGMGLEQITAAPRRPAENANLMVRLDSPTPSRLAPPRQQQQQPQSASTQVPPQRVAAAAPLGRGPGGPARSSASSGGGSDGAGPRDWGAVRQGRKQPAQALTSVRSHQEARCASRDGCLLP